MKLDLSGLDQFKASRLLEPASEGREHAPAEIPLELIDFDPQQPRRSVDENALAGLVASIQREGVLEPVSLRSSSVPGRYIVNRGERRVRASRLAGRSTIPWFLDERADPYLQVAENLQREDLSPFDLAIFIAERERAGDSRAEIARRLHRPASFVTEVAALNSAPPAVRAAFESGRSKDVRALYELSRALQRQPDAVQPLLEGGAPFSRSAVEAAVRPGRDVLPSASQEGRKIEMSKTSRALLVEYQGRRGRLALLGQPGRRTGQVAFEDGTRQCVELSELRLLTWTAR